MTVPCLFMSYNDNKAKATNIARMKPCLYNNQQQYLLKITITNNKKGFKTTKLVIRYHFKTLLLS